MSLRQTVTNDDLMVMPLDEILRLRPENMAHPIISQAAFERIGGLLNAFWKYPEGAPDPHVPHARLTSGACSNFFCNAGHILSFPALTRLFAASLVEIYQNAQGIPGPELPPKWALSSDHAGATFGFAVAEMLGAHRYDFCEKAGADGKEQRWTRHRIEQGVVPVHIEELITTFATAERVRTGVRTFHPYSIEFAPLIALVHRPDLSKEPDGRFPKFEDKPVISGYQYDARNWRPDFNEHCPLCAAGSKPIDNDKRNWAKLVGG